MTENSVVRARINGEVKDEASHILKAMGLTVSDAFRMMMVRIVQEKKLPFSPLEPNDETILAIKEARKGGLKSFNSVNDLMADLNADD